MLTADYGKLGGKFGKKGGRPKIKEGLTDAEHLHGQEYGMDEVEYKEIVDFIQSLEKPTRSVYPKRMRGGSSM